MSSSRKTTATRAQNGGPLHAFGAAARNRRGRGRIGKQGEPRATTPPRPLPARAISGGCKYLQLVPVPGCWPTIGCEPCEQSSPRESGEGDACCRYKPPAYRPRLVRSSFSFQPGAPKVNTELLSFTPTAADFASWRLLHGVITQITNYTSARLIEITSRACNSTT